MLSGQAAAITNRAREEQLNNLTDHVIESRALAPYFPIKVVSGGFCMLVYNLPTITASKNAGGPDTNRRM